MDRLTQHLLLVLVGGLTLRVALTDAHLAYVLPGFRPFLVGAAVVLLALGLLGVVRERPRPDGHGGGHDGPGHGGHVPAVAWLLLVPVAVLLLVAPTALGAFTAARQAQPVVVPEGPQVRSLGPDDPGQDHVTMTVRGYAVLALAADPSMLDDRLVRLTGFVTPRPGGGWYVSRIGISCCAADAVAVNVVVDAPQADLPTDQWVEVIGSWTAPRPHAEHGYREPVITPRSVTPIEPPAETYQG